MNLEREQSRMAALMELDRGMQEMMVRAMPGTCTRADVEQMIRLREGYRDLSDASVAEDEVVTGESLQQRIADVTEWIARGFDSINDSPEALSYFEEARALYLDLGDSAAAGRIDRLVGAINVHAEGRLDDELARVRLQLEQGGLDSLERAGALITLGELLTKAGDDFEAEQPLLEAEQILSVTPLPRGEDLLATLAESMQALMAGTATADNVPIVRAVQLRLLHQRLYFALGNVYRDTNPAKAQEYEVKLAQFDDDDGGGDAAVVAGLMEQMNQLRNSMP